VSRDVFAAQSAQVRDFKMGSWRCLPAE